jgi:hypothetical protein
MTSCNGWALFRTKMPRSKIRGNVILRYLRPIITCASMRQTEIIDTIEPIRGKPPIHDTNFKRDLVRQLERYILCLPADMANITVTGDNLIHDCSKIPDGHPTPISLPLRH